MTGKKIDDPLDSNSTTKKRKQKFKINNCIKNTEIAVTNGRTVISMSYSRSQLALKSEKVPNFCG